MTSAIRYRPTPWTTVLLLCGKCAGKMKGGYGPKGKDTLKVALRSELKATDRRRQVRIIETRCMGLCPKKAVTVLHASRPESIITVQKGTAAKEVLAALMPFSESPSGSITSADKAFEA